MEDQEYGDDGVRVFYISGPMTGVDCLHMATVAAQAQAYLTSMGFFTYNPYGSCFHPDSWKLPKKAWLENDEFWISECCDAILLLPGWEKSEGCQFEVALARELGLDLFVWDDDKGDKIHPLTMGDA